MLTHLVEEKSPQNFNLPKILGTKKNGSFKQLQKTTP